jgi:hypothetical protein
MCLIIEKDYELKVATKDIKVYKIFNKIIIDNYLTTPFMGTAYKLGEKSVSKIRKHYTETGYFDSKEARDYGFSKSDWDFDKFLAENNLTVIQYGIHSIKTLTRAKTTSILGRIIVKCIIPKGSRYIFNKSNLCISDELIPIEIYEPKK